VWFSNARKRVLLGGLAVAERPAATFSETSTWRSSKRADLRAAVSRMRALSPAKLSTTLRGSSEKAASCSVQASVGTISSLMALHRGAVPQPGTAARYIRPISTPDDHETDAAAWLATIGADTIATLAASPRSTIIPTRLQSTTSNARALALLQELGGGSSEGLRIGEVLGQGGMGVVHAAEQVSLGRTVAVKTLKPGVASSAALDLLREAWVTGSLEHPNIVPVHYLTVDGTGVPSIVLKRIEGVEWSRVVADPVEVGRRFDTDDLLCWNLDILGQVLNAVRFAHSRGIIHRDLKPDNVMIGDFGEVYLLDWGIAVSLRDDGSGRLPLAGAATDMAGTPCYMAPEMLGGSTGVPLSERTDIYLCGSMLYEVLAGRAPHDGDTALAVVTSVVKSDPPMPPAAPAELVRICRRAMDPDPDGRFENAEQLRLALHGYLQHRGSERLAGHAEQRVAELSAPRSAPTAAGADAEDRQELYRLFGAARFGFHEALASWRGNQAARDGLRRASQIMVDHELAHGDPRAAAALLAEVDEPPPELTAEAAAVIAAGAVTTSSRAWPATTTCAWHPTRTFLSLLLHLLHRVPAGAAFSGVLLSLRSAGHIALWSSVFIVVLAGCLWARESMTAPVQPAADGLDHLPVRHPGGAGGRRHAARHRGADHQRAPAVRLVRHGRDVDHRHRVAAGPVHRGLPGRLPGRRPLAGAPPLADGRLQPGADHQRGLDLVARVGAAQRRGAGSRVGAAAEAGRESQWTRRARCRVRQPGLWTTVSTRSRRGRCRPDRRSTRAGCPSCPGRPRPTRSPGDRRWRPGRRAAG
jgi:serine/threonine-protein kinase